MKKISVNLPGHLLLEDPLYNKGTAFTKEERIELGIAGLLPFKISTIEQQVQRRYANFCEQPDEIAKYTFLNAMQNRNEILFYRFLMEHIDEMLPYIYTPTVGSISVNYSLLYREQRGLYLSYPFKDKIDEMMANYPREEIDVIVVTDGERILGLGDLGVGGMAIPVGKLALYTLFGGIHPARTLPIVLDVGTDNEKILDDPLYIGWQNKRIRGPEYDAFIEDFIQSVKKHYPDVLLQWEDFAKPHARELLDRYRDCLCSFNDDIQGTASVVLAAVYNGAKVTKTELKDQRFLLLGGGSAGIGICNKIVSALVLEEGLTEEEARDLFFVVDRKGLIHTGMDHITEGQKLFAREGDELNYWNIEDKNAIDLMQTVRNAKPTVLIGVSTQGGAFTEEIIREMHKHVKRPMIFPLSNPNSRSEAHPADLIKWTKGEAIIATGSPFDPVAYQDEVYQIAQCNNVYIFPGVGLGLIATKAKKATDAVFITAAKVLSEHSPMLEDPYAPLFPKFEHLRDVGKEIAVAVAKVIIEEGNSRLKNIDSVEKLIDETMWFPEYPIYTRDSSAKS